MAVMPPVKPGVMSQVEDVPAAATHLRRPGDAIRKEHQLQGKRLREEGKGDHLNPAAGAASEKVGTTQAADAAQGMRPGLFLRITQKVETVLSLPNYAGLLMFVAMPLSGIGTAVNFVRKLFTKGEIKRNFFHRAAEALGRPNRFLFDHHMDEEIAKNASKEVGEAIFSVGDSAHSTSRVMRWLGRKTNSEGLDRAAQSVENVEAQAASFIRTHSDTLAGKVANWFEKSFLGRWADKLAAKMHVRAAAKLARANVPVGAVVNEVPMATVGAIEALQGVSASAAMGGQEFVGAVRNLSGQVSHLPNAHAKEVVTAALDNPGLSKAVRSTQRAINMESGSIAQSIRALPKSISRMSAGNAAWGATVATGTILQAGYTSMNLHADLKAARALIADLTGKPLSKVSTTTILFGRDPIVKEMRAQLFTRYGPQAVIQTANVGVQIAMIRGGGRAMMGMFAMMGASQLADHLASQNLAQTYAQVKAMQAQGQYSVDAVGALLEAAHKGTRRAGLDNRAVATLVQEYVKNKTPALEILNEVRTGIYSQKKMELDQGAKKAVVSDTKNRPLTNKEVAGMKPFKAALPNTTDLQVLGPKTAQVVGERQAAALTNGRTV